MREQNTHSETGEPQGSVKEFQRRSRRRWSREEKRRFLEKWRQGGQSRLKFCREQGLCYSAFLRWQRAEAVPDADGFVEVRIGSDPAELSPASPHTSASRSFLVDSAELIAPNGWRLRLPGGLSSTALPTILECMKRC